ncbi:branched-chain amino acid transport system II carrier protein [Neisseriaceae bacterium CLB008]
MVKNTMVIGFMLFALFFGAGNLIFPPSLGWASGNDFSWAILGFVITGVGLPLLGLIAGAFNEGGIQGEASKVHPLFGLILVIVVYLTIGPLFAIPRTATVAFEMGLVPFIGNTDTNYLPLAAAIYFAVVLYLSINPSKMVDRIGQVLTPMLLISIFALAVRAFMVLGPGATEPQASFNAEAPFFHGFVEGYQTMDTIAAVAFAMIAMSAVKATGVTRETGLFKYTVMASLVAGAGLALVYMSLGWVGNHFALTTEQAAAVPGNLGAYILTEVATLTYGSFGRYLLSIIVTLACLTTATGLVVAVSAFFQSIYPKISYKTYAVLFTVVSFGIATMGLNQVISLSIPVLMVIYPIIIVLIALVYLNLVVPVSRLAMQMTVYTTVVVSLLSVFAKGTIEFLPFRDISMEWLLPAGIALVLGWLINMARGAKG